MPEILKKFLGLFSEGLNKVKEEKMEEALEKFKEASELSTDLQKKSEEMVEMSELSKFFESDKGKETLKKYAEVYISAENAEKLKEEIKTLNGQIKEVSKSLEDLKKEKENDDKTTTEAFKTINEDISEVEKNLIAKFDELSKKAISRNRE
ncbi:hypothetical protein DLH72_02205 [Candidatus Gracilibacteria bacterium]|nr:MAG: hypothetical protein DLH72_02205 [Candidatus Gracilibacteria bacterium]